MTRGQKKQREFLSPSELQGLKDEQAEIRSVIKEVEEGAGTGSKQADVGQLNREVRRIDKVIEERMPEKIHGIAKDNMAKEEKALEERIAEGMPTRDEMRYPTKNPGAVRKHMEWDKRNAANISRYVYIQRQLRPDEPKSIEVLRKEK